MECCQLKAKKHKKQKADKKQKTKKNDIKKVRALNFLKTEIKGIEENVCN